MALTSRKNTNNLLPTTKTFVIVVILFIIVVAFLYGLPYFFPYTYNVGLGHHPQNTQTSATLDGVASTTPAKPAVTHLVTPIPLKAVYMSSWVAGSTKLRTRLVNLIDTTELNAIIIDIKDYTGRISFITPDAALNATGAPEARITDIEDFIRELHSKNIYVIGRISSFQDAYMVKRKPEYAVRRKSDGGVWADHKGISWLDAGAEPVWHYLGDIGEMAYSVGFDELNFDYIRFPSDGNMTDIAYSYSGTRKKPDVLKGFFQYLNTRFVGGVATSTQIERTGRPAISADIFGMTTSNRDDLNIGQLFENALPYFDYIAPMVYPSHYPATFLGYPNPAAKPYEVVKYAMGRGVDRAIAASTTPTKLRPWLQDFSIGHTDYTPDMVRAQMQATYDVGLTSWMLWDASNHYTASALKPQ